MIKVTVSGVIRGYHTTIEFNLDTIDLLPHAIRKLRLVGFYPSGDFRTPDGLPICPIHGTPMQKREKQGDTWFSHRLPGGGYCRGYEEE